MEFDALNWQSIVMAELVDWNWVAHVVHENFTFLGANCTLQSLSRFEADTCDFLVWEHLLQVQLLSLSFLLCVKKFDSPIDTTCCNEI